MPNSRLLAQVLPFDASQDAQGYTYLVPEKLVPDIHAGQLVQIPLRENMVQGLVAHLNPISGDSDTTELKEIDSILQLVPLLQPEQIDTLLRYAEKHAIHIHKVAAFFLPAPIRNRIIKYGLDPFETKILENVALDFPLPELIFFPDFEIVLQEAGKLLETSGVVVISPSDIFTQRVLSNFSGNIETLGIFDAGMTETAKSKSWIDTLRKKYDSVIWTRRLVTYNLRKYQTIVFLEDTLFRELLHSFHRYHALEILSGSLNPKQKLYIYSSTPSIESMSLALAKKIDFTTRSYYRP